MKMKKKYMASFFFLNWAVQSNFKYIKQQGRTAIYTESKIKHTMGQTYVDDDQNFIRFKCTLLLKTFCILPYTK